MFSTIRIRKSCVIVSIIIIAKIQVIYGNFENYGLDLLLPYSDNILTTVEKRAAVMNAGHNCQPHQLGNATHTLLISHHNTKLTQTPLHHVQTFTVSVKSQPPSQAFGHLVWLNNPSQSVHLLEPGGTSGGCVQHKRATVSDTCYVASKISGNQCIAAINAGFFNTHTGSCLGNVVLDDYIKQDDRGIKNVHFGITLNNKLFFGYLTEHMLLHGPWPDSVKLAHLKEKRKSPWRLLVGGVVWLVRNGTSHVTNSLTEECADTEESGTLLRFVTLRSARSAVAADRDGRLIFVQVNGETDRAGMNLYELADFLISLGFQEAINLDGGGSSTLLVNNTLISHPSDYCSMTQSSDARMRCARQVSTVLCACSRVDSSVKSTFSLRLSPMIFTSFLAIGAILFLSILLNMWLCYFALRQRRSSVKSSSAFWTASSQHNEDSDLNLSLLTMTDDFDESVHLTL